MKTAPANTMIRVATVTATGRKYVVQQISFGKTDADHRVHVWGEVLAFTSNHTTKLATNRKHDTAKKFVLSAVKVEDVEPTVVLFNALLEQTKEVRKAAGHLIVGNTDYGTEEQRAVRREFNQALAHELRDGDLGKAVTAAINRTLWT